MCGIPFSLEDFVKDIHAHYGSMEIAKKWQTQFTITASGYDEDFPWMAAEVLWQRLAPNKISTVQLDDMMQEGYTLIEKRNEVGACTLWLKVWEELKPRFDPKVKSIESADSVFSGGQFLSNWCMDLEQELGNAAIRDKKYHDIRISFCREFISLFPESHSHLRSIKRALAESLFISGRTEEAEREFKELVSNYPNDPWGYIAWGDMYAGFGVRFIGGRQA